MNATSFCDTMAGELDSWKGKLAGIAQSLNEVSLEDKHKISPQVNEIGTIVRELEENIEKLRTECPADWELQAKDLNTKLGEVRRKWEILEMVAPGRRQEKSNL